MLLHCSLPQQHKQRDQFQSVARGENSAEYMEKKERCLQVPGQNLILLLFSLFIHNPH